MFDVQRVQQSWQQEVNGINGLVCDLSEAEARAAIREDGWTTQDLLHHITGSARAFRRLIQPAEAGRAALPAGFDRDRWNDEQRAKNTELPWNTTRQNWTKTTHDMSEMLVTFKVEAAERPIIIPWLPQVTNAGDVLRVLVLHTRSHRAELASGLQALAMRNS